MESELSTISSTYFNTSKFQKQIDIVKKASEEAQRKIDYFTAHDEETLHAISIIEEFLKKKHRLCYGGQAINAYLPAKYKFYSPENSIPDYDFFTPDQYKDIDTIVKDLKKAGFLEISVREGMHEGTVKIYVNYIPVADITAIDSKLYQTLSKRESRIDGISYLDANTLRMLMYLELSRPRGEVGRWGKVYERLMLFNEFVSIQSCPGFNAQSVFRTRLSSAQVEYALSYIIEHKRVFAGADLVPFYENSLKTRKTSINWVLHSTKPVIFFSSNSSDDAVHLAEVFNTMEENAADPQRLNRTKALHKKRAYSIHSYSSNGVDLLPSMKVITHGKMPAIFIVDQTACHSYFNVPLHNKMQGKIFKIASIDTLITLYFCFGLMKSDYFESIDCLANQLVHLSINARHRSDTFPFPFVSIKCYGHQTTMPSLIRSKVKRMTSKKINLKKFLGKTNERNKFYTVSSKKKL